MTIKDCAILNPLEQEIAHIQAEEADNTLIRLQQLITQHFSLEELQALCLDLDINYDELGSEVQCIE